MDGGANDDSRHLPHAATYARSVLDTAKAYAK